MKRMALLMSVVLTGALVSTGCRAGPEVVPGEGASAGEFRSTGGVALSGRIPLVDNAPGGASFNHERVVGPLVEMSARSDGSWAGRIAGEPVAIAAGGTQLVGSGINLRFTRREEGLEIGGLWQNGLVRVVVDAKEIRVTSPWRSFSLPAREQGVYGEDGQLRFLGEAGNVPAGPHPQVELALLATLSAG
ncbi:MAG: hypothetical protein L0Y64_16640 [Myxococcaceae bacterium]|nr:hypothetical protein [Myxococcaceae bacterium]